MSEFKMPSLGADMEAGTLVDWHKQPGDRIARGDLIADVETDKGIIGVEAFHSGVLERHVAAVGARVPVGTVLAVIQDDQTASPTTSATSPSAEVISPTPASPPAAVVMTPNPTPGDTERVPMSPSARRLARELGVDPHTVHGTGPGGAITRDDIQKAADATPISPSQAASRIDLTPEERNIRMRQSIAAAMTRSKREIPHYYLSTTIDMHPAMTWLSAENESRPVTARLLYGVLLLKAVARAVRIVPELNAIWDGRQVVLHSQIHVGVAISLRQGGLLAPAIRDVDGKTLDQLMREFRELVTRVRKGGLRASELSDPTITVTSLGENGVESVFGVIYPPQVAIVGFGKVAERPWSVGGEIVSRPVITATLSADHRVSDGHRGAVFLSTVERLLQEPSQL
ncbi:MAG: dihydrolipoamide acetyltransferase family protein [Planctomycetaceae bacterium]|nr:dihydrolipoamide acetyltransferase family protein [Planctomycetaceae bacterium]